MNNLYSKLDQFNDKSIQMIDYILNLEFRKIEGYELYLATTILVSVILSVSLIYILFIRRVKMDLKKITEKKDIPQSNHVLNNEPKNKTPLQDNNIIGNDKNIKKSKHWNIFNLSLQGNDHIKNNIPCQDSHHFTRIDEKFGVAVVCDGAGSQAYSHFGSKYIAGKLSALMAKNIEDSALYLHNQLPTEEEWRGLCKGAILYTIGELNKWIETKKSEYQDISMENIGCTIILVVYSPLGLLIGHIGDGRAGYRLEGENEWHSMMDPFKGEYSNQTVFINTNIIFKDNLENLKQPDNPYLETRVISKPVSAFVIMSDGCEKGLYHIDEEDKKTGKIVDINKPIESFNKLIVSLDEKIYNSGYKYAQDFYEDIVRKGNSALEEEGDDKTLILGFISHHK